MKKLSILIAIISITISGFAQSQGSYTPDSIVMLFVNELNELGPLPKIIPPRYNDLELRGKFYLVFEDSNIWNAFAIGKDGLYRWIKAKETKWYDKTLGPENSNKYTFGIDTLIMVDSTVINYYNTQIKGFKYDKYTYEFEDLPEIGCSREFYEFYKDGKLIEGYTLGWNGTELITIRDWNKFPGKK